MKVERLWWWITLWLNTTGNKWGHICVCVCVIWVNWPFITVTKASRILTENHITFMLWLCSAKLNCALTLNLMPSDCTRLGQKLSTATPSSGQRRQCMIVVNHGIKHCQCGDGPLPHRSVIFKVMHKNFLDLFFFKMVWRYLWVHQQESAFFFFSTGWLFIYEVLMPVLGVPNRRSTWNLFIWNYLFKLCFTVVFSGRTQS